MYAKIENDTVVQYPANPYIDNPQVSFPPGWTNLTVANNTYVRVQGTNPPTPNLGWTVVESTPVANNDIWEQTWTYNLLSNEDIKTAIAAHRYNIEVNGAAVGNTKFATDRESQIKYVAVAVDLSTANVETWSITWKTFNNTFVVMNAMEMFNVISSVRVHVQNCFNKESEYVDLINTANTAVLEATNFADGWPSND